MLFVWGCIDPLQSDGSMNLFVMHTGCTNFCIMNNSAASCRWEAGTESRRTGMSTACEMASKHFPGSSSINVFLWVWARAEAETRSHQDSSTFAGRDNPDSVCPPRPLPKGLIEVFFLHSWGGFCLTCECEQLRQPLRWLPSRSPPLAQTNSSKQCSPASPWPPESGQPTVISWCWSKPAVESEQLVLCLSVNGSCLLRVQVTVSRTVTLFCFHLMFLLLTTERFLV